MYNPAVKEEQPLIIGYLPECRETNAETHNVARVHERIYICVDVHEIARACKRGCVIRCLWAVLYRRESEIAHWFISKGHINYELLKISTQVFRRWPEDSNLSWTREFAHSKPTSYIIISSFYFCAGLWSYTQHSTIRKESSLPTLWNVPNITSSQSLFSILYQ